MPKVQFAFIVLCMNSQVNVVPYETVNSLSLLALYEVALYFSPVSDRRLFISTCSNCMAGSEDMRTSKPGFSEMYGCKYRMRYSEASCSSASTMIYPFPFSMVLERLSGYITYWIRLPLTVITLTACSLVMSDRNALDYASFSTDASLKQIPWPNVTKRTETA